MPDLVHQMSVLRISMPASPISPRMALKPNGWLNSSRVGAAPIKPSGAVKNTRNIAPKLRTWAMITASIRMIITGKMLASAAFALPLSSTEPAVSIRTPPARPP
jgi:hypothetical protein